MLYCSSSSSGTCGRSEKTSSARSRNSEFTRRFPSLVENSYRKGELKSKIADDY